MNRTLAKEALKHLPYGIMIKLIREDLTRKILHEQSANVFGFTMILVVSIFLYVFVAVLDSSGFPCGGEGYSILSVIILICSVGLFRAIEQLGKNIKVY